MTDDLAAFAALPLAERVARIRATDPPPPPPPAVVAGLAALTTTLFTPRL
ncbi:hypothetical protein OG579_16805 [Williamsia herbipolensis]|uniref:Uncharacterized protein n=1 Tax=Williamsia herbipolensis TaxID=1603258 RepID=A0AAU4JZW5_9NOCA|nr:hypothetical protein [Williamsia herbipolensis]